MSGIGGLLVGPHLIVGYAGTGGARLNGHGVLVQVEHLIGDVLVLPMLPGPFVSPVVLVPAFAVAQIHLGDLGGPHDSLAEQLAGHQDDVALLVLVPVFEAPRKRFWLGLPRALPGLLGDAPPALDFALQGLVLTLCLSS